MSIESIILAYFGPSDHELHDIWMKVGKKDSKLALYSVSDENCHLKYSSQRPGLTIFKSNEKPAVFSGQLNIAEITQWVNTER